MNLPHREKGTLGRRKRKRHDWLNNNAWSLGEAKERGCVKVQ